MMKVYLPYYTGHAGHWIYNGYARAWEQLGYQIPDVEKRPSPDNRCTEFLHPPMEESDLEEDYILMATDALAVHPETCKAIERSYKTFLFAQPNVYPKPWGDHPNYQCAASDKTINILNQMDNVYLWTFGEVNPEYHHKWKKVHTVPLAFDSVSYKPIKDENYSKYDVSFVGGWVNNGFDEKRKIMMDIFIEFKKSGLNCGFFVNRNLNHEQETAVLYNSKISLNIHDAYQRILGNDTNERTFKSIGLNGILISDKVKQLENILPNVKTSNEPAELVRFTKEYLSLTEKEINDIKEENRQDILDNHCYTHRVEQLLAL
jgi:spore maturation protein CgeB